MLSVNQRSSASNHRNSLVCDLSTSHLCLTQALYRFQDTRFAMTYSTLGYLVAIMSLLSFPIMPRAKFVQTMILNIVILFSIFQHSL